MFYSDPPYFLVLAGLLAGILSGTAFEATLKQTVREWKQQAADATLKDFRSQALVLPFIGIGLGICLFLASGLQIFGFPANFAYAAAIPLTIASSWLVWWQLGKVLVMFYEGGSKALDLDSFG
ncbi:MAG: hypothetical protein HC925_06070 [Coleofasciculaceae cyanobacterium SM2_3_26]|nr:hypothetical protein [Coleofasciculaceae cyanobacterium SM2_3_26]